jgi:hypothetical protein
MKLLETAGTMEWEIIGIFESEQEIDQWVKENWNLTYEDFKKEMEETEDWSPSREEWYEENEIRVREIPEHKK